MGWWSRLFSRKPEATRREEPSIDGPVESPTAGGHSPLDAEAARTLRDGSPEFDEYIVRGELDTGTNLPHAATHLANLLLVDPRHPRWLELLDRLAAAAGPALEALVPDVDVRHASTEALRAWIWQRQGRLDDAVSRLVGVTQAIADPRMLDGWALGWLEPAGAVESLPESTGLQLFGTLLNQNTEALHATAAQVATLRRWSALLERAAPAWEATSLLRMLRAGLLRKAGRFDDALAVAGSLQDAVDGNHVAAIGLALRASGQPVESARTFEHGAHREPDNEAQWLEAGDSWVEAAHWHEALHAYEAALALRPDSAWAEASALYCRWKIDGDEPWRQRLGQAATGGNARAHALLFRELGAVEESGDASANILRQWRAAWQATPRDPAAARPRLTVSTIEAPSVRLAIALELAAHGLDPDYDLVVEGVPDAEDPRVPCDEVDHLLWHYDGLRAEPALPPPDPSVAALVAALAAKPFDPGRNWAQASHVAARLGPAAVDHLLAAMVYPSPVPAGTHALAWLPRVQSAAAMVIAQIDAGWEGSVRRAALRSLLLGPGDWTTGVGIEVLARIARDEPAHAQDIERLFRQRAHHLPAQGHWDWIDVLHRQWVTLPWLSQDERDAIEALGRAV